MNMKFIFDILIFSGVFSLTNLDSLATEKTLALKKYDFMVAIYQFGVQYCGGSLIRKDVVLTAFHCAIHRKESYFIYFESNNIRDIKNKTIYKVSSIYGHKDRFIRDYGLPINEIALMKLEKNVENSVPIEISELDYKDINGPVTFIGWGDRLDGGGTWDLEILNLNILNHNCCVNAHYEYSDYLGREEQMDLYYFVLQMEKNNDTFICTEGIGESIARLNHRDSGGPLFLTNGTEYKLVGVASHILSTGKLEIIDKPISVFKNLNAYKVFISDGIEHFNKDD